MTNDGLLFKLHAIEPIGSADPFVQFKAMQPLWTTEVTTELGVAIRKQMLCMLNFDRLDHSNRPFPKGMHGCREGLQQNDCSY